MARPSQWNRPTKMIRVPIEFEQELLKAAHVLDSGGKLCFESEPDDAKYSDSEIDGAIVDVLVRAKISDRVLLGKGFDRLRHRLKNPPQ